MVSLYISLVHFACNKGLDLLKVSKMDPKVAFSIGKSWPLQMRNQITARSAGDEIACYLWPVLLDGGGRVIRPGEVLCKVEAEAI